MLRRPGRGDHSEIRGQAGGKGMIHRLLQSTICFLVVALLPKWSEAQARALPNEPYEIRLQPDGSVRVIPQTVATFAQTKSEGFLFRPEFTVLDAAKLNPLTSVKWQNPVYNLVGWKGADGTVVQDVFHAGASTTLREP